MIVPIACFLIHTYPNRKAYIAVESNFKEKEGFEMRSKVFILCIMAAILLSSLRFTEGAGKVRVLYDRTHDEHFAWLEKAYFTDEGIKTHLEANGFDVTIYKKGNLDYELLQNYDVLIICVPRIRFTESERQDIVTFVKNGGGLYVLGTRSSRFYAGGTIEEILNPLSTQFGVTFTSVNILSTTRIFQVKSSHEVTMGVKEIRNEDWTTITIKSPAEMILSVEGYGFLAYDISGFGKAVFSADDAVLTLNYLDNLKLSVNVLNWISTYGGPYKNYQKRLASANSLYESAMKLYNEGNIIKAKDTFTLAKERFETLLSFYKTGEHIGKIATCDTYIKKINDELSRRNKVSEAQNMLAQGRSLFDSGEYLQAQQILEKAKEAFQTLNMTNEYAQASDLLSRVDEELKKKEEEIRTQEEERLRLEKEKADKEAAQKRTYTYLTIGAALLLILIVVVIFFFRRKPKRREIIEERKTLTRKFIK